MDIDHFRSILIAQREETQAAIIASSGSAEIVSLDLPIGRLTRNDAMQQQQVALHQGRMLTLQLARIDAALRRIEEGQYGTCLLCRTPIDTRRLEVAPESHLCVSCLAARKQ